MTAGPIIVATSSLVAASSPSIWQRRYWEHTIRDENDFARHVYPRGLGWRCLGSWRCVRRTAGRTRGEMMDIASLHHLTQSITPAVSLATLVLPRRQPHTRMGGEQRCASIAIYGRRWVSLGLNPSRAHHIGRDRLEVRNDGVGGSNPSCDMCRGDRINWPRQTRHKPVS
jgi:hypothetical protein